jgi:hypothetical protein
MLTLPFQTRRRRAYIESYAFPAALRTKLREKFDDDRQVAVALEGLREWYLACLAARGKMLGMPSRAVDIAWHEMILMTREYHHFCRQAFGEYLHHTPDSVMDVPMNAGLASTLAILESQALTVAGVPLLFAVDRELGIEDGFFWQAEDIERIRASQDAEQMTHHSTYHAGTASLAGCVGAGDGHGGGGGGCGGGGCGGGG